MTKFISKIYHAADYVFWQSNFCKKSADRFLGERVGKGEVLYNAIDTKKFYPVKKNSDNIFRFLITGNIIPYFHVMPPNDESNLSIS